MNDRQPLAEAASLRAMRYQVRAIGKKIAAISAALLLVFRRALHPQERLDVDHVAWMQWPELKITLRRSGI
jgi:hypothetical protein